MKNFNVNAVAFARAFLCASTEQVRYYLGGVCIEPAKNGVGVTLTATDGNALVSIYDETGSAEETVIVKIPKHMLRACVPDKKGNPARLIGNALPDGGSIAEIADKKGDFQTARDVIIDGTFPDWRRIIVTPGDADKNIGILDIGLLAKVARAVNESRASDKFYIEIRSTGPNDPHRVFGNDASAYAVIMPERTGAKVAEGLPAWI